MPILNYDKEYVILPALNEQQECDECGAKQTGQNMWFSYPPNEQCRALCHDCLYTRCKVCSPLLDKDAPKIERK